MTHKDAPPETPTQAACREWWTKRQPHVARAWGRDKRGAFLAEEARLLHEAWCANLPARNDSSSAIKPAFWAAISDDQEVIVAYSTDDGNGGMAARCECNQYINDALLNDRAALRLVGLYTDAPSRSIEKVECGGAAPPVYVEPKAPKAPAWIDGGEGYWNESNDVYTSPIDIGEWGARIECHGLSQKDAEDLRAEVLRLVAAPADLNQAIVEAREHLLALVKSRALAAEGERPGEWIGPYIKSEM